MEVASFFEKLNKISLYLVVFLLPLFFLPYFPNAIDFPKHFFLLFFLSLSFFGWLGEKIVKQKVTIFYHPSIFFFILFFLFSFFSLFFTLSSPLFSFLGIEFNIEDSFVSSILYFLLFFLILNSFEKEDLPFLIFLFSLSFFLANFFTLLQLQGIFIIPFDFAKNKAFNTIGTPQAFAIFNAVSILLILYFLTKKIGYLKIFFFLSIFVALFNLLLINFPFSWILLLLETLILFLFCPETTKLNFLIYLSLFLILSLCFYFLPISTSLSPEILLSQRGEILILKNAFGQSLKNLFFGTGPATFVFAFAKYRLPLFNQTPLWNVRFERGASAFLDLTLTHGILGIFSFFLFFLFLLKDSFKKIKERKNVLILVLFSASLGIIFAFFFYPFNVSLFSLLFCLFAFLAIHQKEKREFSLSSFGLNFIFNFLFFFSLLFSFSLLFLEGRMYFANFYYQKANQAFREQNLNLAISFLEKAKNFNFLSDRYLRDLALAYLTKANLVAQDKNLNETDRAKLVNEAILKGGEAINKATQIAPFNSANWSVRGFFFRNLIGIEGAEQIALYSYQRAFELDSSSPYYFGEKGRIYILLAQNSKEKEEKEKNLNLAIENLKNSLKLKEDYAISHYLLAVAYDQLGEREKAIEKLENTEKLAPFDLGVAFQLGVLYWRKGDLEKAKKEFERILTLNPENFNAKYMLGIIYDQEGNKERAKEIFKNLLKENPGNEELKRILDNLEKGLSALEGIGIEKIQIENLPK